MSTPLLFYEHHDSLWNTALDEDEFLPRTYSSPVMTSISEGGTRVAVLKHRTELQILTLSTVPSLIANSVSVALEMIGANERVVDMSWSGSGMTLGVGTLHGRVLLFSCTGVHINALDLSHHVKMLSTFACLTDSLLLLAAVDGQLWTHHSLNSRTDSVLSVHRYHCWPQMTVIPHKRICAVGGVSKNLDFNVTVWRMNRTLDEWSLLYNLRDPLSGFQAWRKPVPDRASWCRMDFSPSGKSLMVSRHGQPPVFLRMERDRIVEVPLNGIPDDVLQTSNDALFWDDDILALTTNIGKMLFVGSTDGAFRILSTATTPARMQLLGRCIPNGIMTIAPQHAAEWVVTCKLILGV